MVINHLLNGMILQVYKDIPVEARHLQGKPPISPPTFERSGLHRNP